VRDGIQTYEWQSFSKYALEKEGKPVFLRQPHFPGLFPSYSLTPLPTLTSTYSNREFKIP